MRRYNRDKRDKPIEKREIIIEDEQERLSKLELNGHITFTEALDKACNKEQGLNDIPRGPQ